jgi:hypothetical protein
MLGSPTPQRSAPPPTDDSPSAPARAFIGGAAGAAVGAAAGAAFSLGFAGLVLLGCHGDGCEPAGFAILGVPGTALIGAVVGAPIGVVVGLCLAPDGATATTPTTALTHSS